MPIAASSSAQPPNTDITHMLNFWRDTETDTMSSIDFTSVTGSPVDCRSCSWMVLLSDCGGVCVRTIQEIGVRLDVQRVRRVRHLRLRDEHLRLRLAVEPVALDVGDDADDLTLAFGRRTRHDALADEEPVGQRIALRPELPAPWPR